MFINNFAKSLNEVSLLLFPEAYEIFLLQNIRSHLRPDARRRRRTVGLIEPPPLERTEAKYCEEYFPAFRMPNKLRFALILLEIMRYIEISIILLVIEMEIASKTHIIQ